jgi:phage-related protein
MIALLQTARINHHAFRIVGAAPPAQPSRSSADTIGVIRLTWEVVFYASPSGKQPVLSWLGEQPADVRAAIAHLFDLLETNGTAMGEPHVKPLGKKLYELRVNGRDGTYRTLYFAARGRRFVMVHGFQKKTQKTPKPDLEKALKRMHDFLATDPNP